MDWTAFSEPYAAPRLVSVALWIGLALWLVWLNGSSKAHRALALFLASFALAVFFNTMGAFAADPGKEAWFTLTKHAELLEIPALVYFISVYPRTRGWFGRNPIMRANLFLAAAAVELWMVADPSAWYTSADSRSGLAVGVAGPVSALAKDNVAIALVALVLAFDVRRLQPGPRRSGLLLMWLAFAVNALYDSTTSTAFVVRAWLSADPLPEHLWNQVSYWLNIAALGLAVAAVAAMARSLWMRPGTTLSREGRLLAAVLPWPVLLALLELSFASGVELFDSPLKLAVNGLVRITFASLATYALVRYKVLDIDLQLKWTLRQGTVLAMLAGLFFVVSNSLELALDAGGWLPNLVAAGVIALALWPLQWMAKAAMGRVLPRVEDTPGYRLRRQREMYRHAIESALEDGEVTDKERRMLQTLASELGIASDEAVAIERDAVRGRGMAG